MCDAKNAIACEALGFLYSSEGQKSRDKKLVDSGLFYFNKACALSSPEGCTQFGAKLIGTGTNPKRGLEVLGKAGDRDYGRLGIVREQASDKA